MKHILTVLPMMIGLSASVAHANWILPSTTVLSAPQFVTFDASATHDPFQFNGRALVLDTLVITAPDSSKVQPVNLMKGEVRSVFDLKLEQKGTYHLDLLRAGFRASWKDAENKPKRFMGTAEALAKEVPADAKELKITESVSHIESFVTVGAPTKLITTGKYLELVMGTHPNDLAAGEPVELTFFVDGKPAEGVEVGLIRGQTQYRNNLDEKKYKTDKNGKVKVTLQEAGLYWLDADFKDNNVSNKLATERALTYAIALEVLPQ
jgi:uncharacterized GH25 family protein